MPKTNKQEVKLFHIPTWLNKEIKRAFKEELAEYDKEVVQYDFLRSAIHIVKKSISISQQGPSHWLDHWGSLKVGMFHHFVSEPYGKMIDYEKEVETFCNRIDCYYSIVKESEWNPPYSYRITLYEPGFILGGK